MIKRLLFSFVLLVSMASITEAQIKEPALKIEKLVLKKNQKYTFGGKDSVVSINIDTLVMNDKSSIIFFNKKDVNLLIKHFVIGKNCLITGTDGKNNGTNLTLSAGFAEMKKLIVDVSGQDAKLANRKYPNGNGGKVAVNYLASGVKPSLSDGSAGNLEIRNRAGGYRTNAQSDLYVVYSRIRSGSPGRPLSQLPQGQVYSGNIGLDGKVDVNLVTDLASAGKLKPSEVSE